jgi:sodium/proline symporter
MIVGSFLFFLLVFLTIGFLSVFKSTGSTKDYLLASANIKPWLAGLSAIATSNSGFMFVGMIGYTYFHGLSSLWLMFGYIFGDYLASIFTHQKLRVMTEKTGSLSFAGVLSKWHQTDFKKLRFLIGVITILFLGSYAAAQFQAGSKALHVLFGWNYNTGAVLGAVMVFLYCMAGGIRASIWTDVAQSFVMLIGMCVLCVKGIHTIGGFEALWMNLKAVGPDYIAFFPHNLDVPGIPGYLLFVTGWVFGGIGIIGQPHILVRFMIVDTPGNVNKARAYYYSWYIVFFSLTVIAGLVARILLPATESFDPELALPMLATQMLPPIFIGLVMAGLFAATMSTADSQILSCTAAVTRDLFPNKKENMFFTKMSTLAVTLVALVIAMCSIKSVFVLAVIAWSALGSAFGPLLLLYSFNKKTSESTAIVMMLGGLTTSLLWRYFGLSQQLLELAPGIMMGFAIYIISSTLISQKVNSHKE